MDIYGRLLVRCSTSKPRSLDPAKKLVMVVGVLAVPNDFPDCPLRSDFQYHVKGEFVKDEGVVALAIDTEKEINLEMISKMRTIGSMLHEDIWGF